MSDWAMERAAAAFPVGSRVLVCGAEVGRIVAVAALNGDGPPAVRVSTPGYCVWHPADDLTLLPDPTLKVWAVSLSAAYGHDALGNALNWGTVAWLVLAHDREAAAAIAQGHVEGLHPDWPQDEVVAGLRVEPEPWGDTADLARPRVLVAWVE